MNEINKKRKRSILFTMMIIISAIVVITSVIFTFVLIEYRTKDLIEKSDETLFMAAELTREIVGADYHDKIDNEFSVTNEQFNKIVARNDDLCRRLKLQYLWSVLVIGDRIVFTSATHSDLTKSHSPCATFFETHSDPDAFAAAIHSGLKPSFSTFKNKWGKGRMVLVPRKDARGRTYIFGASVQLTEFNEIVYRSIITSIGIGLAVILCGLVLALILSRLITLPIAKLTKAASIMATGNLDITLEPTKTLEMQSLSAALDQMRQGIKNHISALRDSDDRLKFALEASSVGAWDLDLVDHSAFRSPQHDRIFGYPELLPQWTYEMFLEHVLPEDRPDVDRKFKHAVETHGEWNFECHIRRVDGEVRYIWASGRHLSDNTATVRRMAGIVHDITDHRQAVAAMIESDKRFSSAFEFAAIGMALVSPEGTFLKVNQTLCNYLGYTQEELTALTFQEITHPDDLEADLAYVHQMLAGEINTYQMEKRYFGKQGNLIWIILSVSLVRDEQNKPQYFISQIRDITSRKRTEDALQRSQKLLAETEKIGKVGGWELNIDTGKQAWTEEIYNIHELDLTFDPTLENGINFYTPTSLPIIDQAVKMSIEDNKPFDLELEIITAKGNLRHVHAIGKPDLDHRRVYGFFQDTTARKLAEEKLRESEAQLRDILNATPFPIALVDVQDNNIVFWSRSALTLFGHIAPTAPDWYQIAYPDPDYRREVIDRWKPFLEIARKSRKTVNTGEYRVTCSDGSVCICELYATFLADSLIVTFNDITARKQAEAEKAALEAQNRQLQKSESLGRMAASIAHHFNNQLGVVIGNLEMAIDDQPKDVPPSRSLAAAMQAAWKSADMSGLMLTYLGQTHNERESLDLSYSCRKILPVIKTTLPGNVVMETDFPLPRPIIMANAGEIQQILTNLITNAWESIGKDSGTLSLCVKTVSPIDISTTNRFPVDWESLGKTFACLEVTDTGCGIEEKDMEKLFDPFYSTKFTGRGMGLAVVLGLANSHKGVITVDSKPGSGSTFRLFFPVSEETLRQSQAAETDRDVSTGSPSSKKMEGGGTVLVVEDEEMLRDMAAAMLESSGFTVLKAKDGIDALEIFDKYQSEIKFVLTDLTMPRMNGWDTLTALRKLQPDIPVILASGYDLAHVMEGDHPELPQAFLAKPYNLKSLRAAIRQALEKLKER